MATSKEIDDFIKFVMEKRELSYASATAFTIGFFTQYIPSDEIAKAIAYMESK